MRKEEAEAVHQCKHHMSQYEALCDGPDRIRHLRQMVRWLGIREGVRGNIRESLISWENDGLDLEGCDA